MPDPRLVSAASVLPESWSPRRVAEACRKGRVPGAVKVGKEWLVRVAAVEAWLDDRAMPTDEEFDAILREKGLR